MVVWQGSYEVTPPDRSVRVGGEEAQPTDHRKGTEASHTEGQAELPPPTAPS